MIDEVSGDPGGYPDIRIATAALKSLSRDNRAAITWDIGRQLIALATFASAKGDYRYAHSLIGIFG